jgi:hypothetical protein
MDDDTDRAEASMLTFLRVTNITLLVALVACIAGALAGLIVLVPFLAGAWALNLMALVSWEERERPGWIERTHALPERGELAEPTMDEGAEMARQAA